MLSFFKRAFQGVSCLSSLSITLCSFGKVKHVPQSGVFSLPLMKGPMILLKMLPGRRSIAVKFPGSAWSD